MTTTTNITATTTIKTTTVTTTTIRRRFPGPLKTTSTSQASSPSLIHRYLHQHSDHHHHFHHYHHQNHHRQHHHHHQKRIPRPSQNNITIASIITAAFISMTTTITANITTITTNITNTTQVFSKQNHHLHHQQICVVPFVLKHIYWWQIQIKNHDDYCQLSQAINYITTFINNHLNQPCLPYLYEIEDFCPQRAVCESKMLTE